MPFVAPAFADSVGLNRAMLMGLMTCAGADGAAELRQQFLADLAMVERGFRGHPSLAQVGRYAHVLAGLAGQGGAERLATRARALMTAAQAQDRTSADRIVPDILAGLAAFQAIVSALPLPPHSTRMAEGQG